MRFIRDQLKPFIYGLPCLNETWPKLLRMPPRTTKILSRSIQRLSTNLSGARLRFTAETEFVKIKATLLTKNAMDNFSKNGEMGLDLFVDNRHWIPFYHPRKIDTTFHIQVKSPHYIEFYLPLYGNLNLKEIEVEGTIESPPPYRDPRPIIYYGSSITQGGCASRAGLSYQAMIERKLNLDFVNLGLSGNGRGDLVIAQLIAEWDPLLIVLDYGANLLEDKEFSLLQDRYEKFYSIIREKHPTTPILLINLPKVRAETQSPSYHEYVLQYRQHIEGVYNKLKEEGDNYVWLIPALSFIGLNDDIATVDGTHPNDLGFSKYAEKILEFIKNEKILPL